MATTTACAHTDLADSRAAGAFLAARIVAGLDGSPQAVIVFASAKYDFKPLLQALSDGCGTTTVIGSSSAGEYIRDSFNESSVCAVGLRSDTMSFRACIGTGIAADRGAVARSLVAGFAPGSDFDHPHRAALVLTDALAGHADELVEEITLLTSREYQLFGGGAGDDARFKRTHVFCADAAYEDAAVALEIRSRKPIGVGVSHAWEPVGRAMRVTESDGRRLISLDAVPARDIFVEHAARSGQRLDLAAPVPFFLHNVLGIVEPGGFRLRVPLGILDDGSVLCAAEIPRGARVHLMTPGGASAGEAVARARAQIGGATPSLALFFDCVATRLRMGAAFGHELGVVERAIDGAPCIGCNTYGQIARAEGQFNGFHNCTAVACLLPE